MMAMLGVAAALALLGTVALAARIFVLKSMQPNFDNWHRIPGTTPVVVALTNKLPRRKLDVVIVRRANINPQDLILVRPRAARAELLARAVQTLQRTRHTVELHPSRDAVVEVEPAGADHPPRVGEAEGWVRSLQQATVMWLPGVGPARFLGLHVFDSDGAGLPKERELTEQDSRR